MSANLFDDELEEGFDREGFRHRGAAIGEQAGTSRIGASLYEVEPGQATCPYHWHAGNEEMLLVLSGTLAVRTPEGEREVDAGEVIAFPRGERGGHQLIARGDQPARFLMVSELNRPDIVVYPDSGKVGVRAEGLRFNFRTADAVDYFDGEEPPR